MPFINWLHLSDLHIVAQDCDERWKKYIINEFLGDHLKALIEKNGEIDLIFITGDLTECGDKQEFNELTNKLIDFIDIFQQESNLVPKLVVVPGNHDFRPINLNELDGSKKIALESLCNWEEDEKIQYDFFESNIPIYTSIITESFYNYMEWCDKNSNLFLPQVQKGYLPGDFCGIYEKEGFKLGIIGLNSAFLQLTTERGDVPLLIDIRQFQKVYSQTDIFEKWINQQHTNILLTHHAPNKLNKESQNTLKNISSYFSMHLCGHMGEEPFSDNRFRNVWQAPSFFGAPFLRNQEIRKYGYSFGKLEYSKVSETAEIHIAFMRYVPLGDRTRKINLPFTKEYQNSSIIKLNFEFKHPVYAQISTPSIKEEEFVYQIIPKIEEPYVEPQQTKTEATKVAEPEIQQSNEVEPKPEVKPLSDKEKQTQVDIAKESAAKTVREVPEKIILPNYQFLKVIKDNVLDVRSYKNDGQLTGGTGFFFTENLFITCYHCVGDRSTDYFYSELHITNIKGEIQITVIERLSSVEHDYAILYIDNPQGFKRFNNAFFSCFIEDNDNYEKKNAIVLADNTKFYGYGFSNLNERTNKRDKTPILDATFIAEMELPTLEHPIIYAFETQQVILEGQSGSPICPYIAQSQVNALAMCQGYRELGGYSMPKMYALPMEVVLQNYDIDLDKIKTEFYKSHKFISVELNSGHQYFISVVPITIEKLNGLFRMQLSGINAYVAQSFAELLGFSLPTEKQWNYAVKAGRIRLPAENKEWVIESSEDYKDADSCNLLLASQINKTRSFAEQRPEAYADNYVFRLVSDKPV